LRELAKHPGPFTARGRVSFLILALYYGLADPQMRFNIPRIPFVVGMFLLTELVVLRLFAKEPSDHVRATYSFTGTILAGAFALFAFLRGMDDKRMDASARLIERWNAPDRYELRRVMKLISEEKIDTNTLARATKGQTQSDEVLALRMKVIAMLNFYEELAICVKDKSVNEDKLYDFFDNVLSEAYTRLKSFIENERKIDGSNAYYCEMEWLALRWRNRH
jgi:hypothetical protein